MPLLSRATIATSVAVGVAAVSFACSSSSSSVVAGDSGSEIDARAETSAGHDAAHQHDSGSRHDASPGSDAAPPSRDAMQDGGHDGTTRPGHDARVDTGHDAEPPTHDATQEAAHDSATDAEHDAAHDAHHETPDAGHDAAHDAHHETPDAGHDASTASGHDAKADQSVDAPSTDAHDASPPCSPGACTPTLSFNAGWTQTWNAPFIQGGSLTIDYDWSRLPTCRASSETGEPGWMITVYYTFDGLDAGTTPQSVEVMKVVGGSGPGGGAGQAVQVNPTIALPSTATNIWLWAVNTDDSGCNAYDSNLDQNYELPIFSTSTLGGTINWAGSVDFVIDTSGNAAPQGDVDPAYYFQDPMQGEEVTTWVQVEVYQPGITDRTYQSDAVTAQVAATTLVAQVNTNASSSDLGPTGPMGMQALAYLGLGGTDDHNFVYQWAPAALMMDSSFPSGAYRYMYSLEQFLGTTATTIGAPGDNTAMRTMVLSQDVDCSLFPSNPPSEYCP
jgi:hypothetical protein